MGQADQGARHHAGVRPAPAHARKHVTIPYQGDNAIMMTAARALRGPLLQAALPLLTALVLAAAPAMAGAQGAYPAKPIHLIVAYPPGGLTDTLARTIG